VVAGRKLDHSRLTLLQMLAELNHPEMDYRRLEFIVSQDSSLSYKLLRLINSAHFGLRVEISGIHQALTLLGVQQIQGWLSLLLMTDTSDKPVELMNIACIRSKMCELIAKRMSITETESYFMVGLLSSLDAIMDQTMDRLLESLPVTAEIKKALLAYEGHLGAVLRSVLAYERGLWDEAILPGFQPSMLFDIYLDSVEWATKTTDSFVKSLDESPAKK
jgi:EAL and modified HD-GYP domain-containing signal transduction protein